MKNSTTSNTAVGIYAYNTGKSLYLKKH